MEKPVGQGALPTAGSKDLRPAHNYMSELAKQILPVSSLEKIIGSADMVIITWERPSARRPR